MIRFIGSLFLIIAVAGCPSVGVPMQGAGANPDFPEVTDRLRQACFTETDAAIAGLIELVQSDRANGFTRQDEIMMVTVACQQNPNVGITITLTDCLGCGTALVEHVYGP